MTHPLALSHEAHGPVAGLPVLLLHGFPFDRHLWDGTAASLAHAGFRAVAVDLPNHGESPLAPNGHSIRAMAADVLATADRLGLPRVAVVGHSMGGYVALEMALAAPARLAGLVLVGSRAEPDAPENRKARLELAHAVRAKGVRVIQDAMLPKLLPAATQRERPGLVRDTKAWFAQAPSEAVARTLESLADRRDLRPLLPSIAAPTLVVAGAADETMGTAPSEAMAKAIPGARLEIVPGCGHLPMLEAPARFKAPLVEFLRTLA